LQGIEDRESFTFDPRHQFEKERPCMPGCMNDSTFTVTLINYDHELCTPPGHEAEFLAGHGISWVVGQHRSEVDALRAAQDADVVIVHLDQPPFDRKLIQKLDRCRCLVRMGIGYDSIDVPAATEKGILVCNVPGFCTAEVAEHALALMLDAARHTSRLDRDIRAGGWDRTKASPARRMAGCTLGLVAFGAIARTLAKRVRGFDMKVLAYDPNLRAETIAEFGAQKVELNELLRSSDYISIHAPLTSETRHLIGKAQFDLMKVGVILVNTGRGPVVDEQALVEALKSGKLWGAGLDVMEQEPLPANSPLRQFDNVVFTPHVASNSAESVSALYRKACEIGVDVCEGRWPKSVVNPEVEGHTKHKYVRST
jgi:D-3-phosphoglycerate dehydrogenase / 2-oxoglutarate reductase